MICKAGLVASISAMNLPKGREVLHDENAD
jgi:hypothetical protein